MATRRKLETILTENGLVSAEQLKQIANYAHAVGIDLHEAVLQKKVAPPDAVMMAYAESVGLPFAHLADMSFDEEVIVQIDPMTARQHSLVPVSIDQGHILLVTTKPIIPDVASELQMLFSMPVRCMLCSPAELSEAITKYYPRGATRIVKTKPDETPLPKPAPKKPKPKSEPVEPMSEQEIKDRLLKTIIAFNFTVAAVYFGLYYSPLTRWIDDGFVTLMSIGVCVGCVAAFVVWRVLSR